MKAVFSRSHFTLSAAEISFPQIGCLLSECAHAVSPGKKPSKFLFFFGICCQCCSPPIFVLRPPPPPADPPHHRAPTTLLPPPGLTKIQFTGCQLDSIILSAAPWWRGSSLNPPFTVAPGYSYIYRRLPHTTSATSVFHTTPPPLGWSSRRVGESCSVSLEIKTLFPPSPLARPTATAGLLFFSVLGGMCVVYLSAKRKKKKNREKKTKHSWRRAFPVAAAESRLRCASSPTRPRSRERRLECNHDCGGTSWTPTLRDK